MSSSQRKVWLDPASLADEGDISEIGGNLPDHIKQQSLNVYLNMGVSTPSRFGYKLGRSVKWIEYSIHKNPERNGRAEAITLGEIVVTEDMLNGADTFHGACLSYLIDICGNGPVVIFGLDRGLITTGISQSLNVTFHSPAHLGDCLRIKSTCFGVGKRIRTAKCEIYEKESGRMICSGLLTTMEPDASRL
ncbi:hypothetical protein Agabi119p4_9260 [Agaricus bisporus var. burnettii]|uniref:Thioesterase domain-containing protein n=1 Tax=Agaricus bisporus var. burnettii TaxID=192524 RepID=A0A8H7C5J1_AGABI|nr:hypothetical protein Agabi119p4_9260 [Agaricus bisporus var. burnettii]